MNVRFACPNCECVSRQEPVGQAEWQCPACEQRLALHGPPADGPLVHCAACGNAELYKKKDFPHWLGIGILTVACLAFLLGNLYYHQWWAWAILIGSAIFDGALYLWVGDAVVCYRCGAQHRRLPSPAEYKPFDLTVHERYRQERLRREQLKQ